MCGFANIVLVVALSRIAVFVFSLRTYRQAQGSSYLLACLLEPLVSLNKLTHDFVYVPLVCFTQSIGVLVVLHIPPLVLTTVMSPMHPTATSGEGLGLLLHTSLKNIFSSLYLTVHCADDGQHGLYLESPSQGTRNLDLVYSGSVTLTSFLCISIHTFVCCSG